MILRWFHKSIRPQIILFICSSIATAYIRCAISRQLKKLRSVAFRLRHTYCRDCTNKIEKKKKKEDLNNIQDIIAIKKRNRTGVDFVGIYKLRRNSSSVWNALIKRIRTLNLSSKFSLGSPKKNCGGRCNENIDPV